MIESVHIPIFCDNLKAEAGALLTLKTVRVGFPTVPVSAHYFGENDDVLYKLLKQNIAAVDIGTHGKRNDQLIKHLVETEQKGFAVVDSDVVFFDNCEGCETDGLIAGEFIPPFNCPIAGAVTYSRLHTAFLIVPDPTKLRDAIARAYHCAFSKFCPFDPFAPVVTFVQGEARFHDSCSVLFHAVGGTAFDAAMLDKFQHCYSGSYAHRLPWPHADWLDQVYTNPARARGFRKVMDTFFADRKAVIA